MNCYEMRVIVMTWGESSHPLAGLQCDDSWQCMFVVNDMRRITTSWWWFMTLYVYSKWTRCDRMLHAIIDEMREVLPPMFSREPEDRAVRTLHTQYTVHWWGLADIITHLRQRVISKHHRGLSMSVYLHEYDRAFMPWWWLLAKAELCIHNEWQLRCVWSTESSQTITCSIRVGAWSPKEGTPLRRELTL